LGSKRSPAIVWTSDDTFELGGTAYVCDPFSLRLDFEPERFCLGKVPRIVDRYEAFLAELAPRIIVEVGIMEGASTAMLAELARPDKLIAIDNLEARNTKLQDFITRRGFEDTISVYGGVDQADAERIRAIIDDEIGDDALDLVLDDASHLLDATRRTFNCLFPRLRPGGIYLLEDWATGLKADGPAPLESEQLVTLVFELIAAKGRHPSLIGDVTVKGGWVLVERGKDPIGPSFDVSQIASA
jgi:predicted O-methyltransferase YrrM